MQRRYKKVDKFLFPWESHVMKKYPLAMSVFLLVLSIMLSIITWVRQKK